MKRVISFAIAITLIITMYFGGIGTAKVYAEDFVALTVYDGDELVKEYSLEELQAIAKAEGDKLYKYSGYNRNPSFYVYGDPDNKDNPPRDEEAMRCIGPTVAGLLADAGVTYTDDQTITFVAADGLKESFQVSDFFRERYYFPKGDRGTWCGAATTDPAAYEDAEVTVPIIDINDSENEESVLRFGQVEPNEQNVAVFVKYIADGGAIIIDKPYDAAWEDITTANYNSGEIMAGAEIKFELSQSLKGKKVQVYYTMDGTEPGYGSDIYNFDKYGTVRDVMIPADQEIVTIKVKVKGYGKLDSNTTTFTYKVVKPDQLDDPMDFSAVPTDDNKIQLTWSPVEGAAGYEIEKLNPEKGKFEVLTGTEETAYVDEDVEIGVEYQYVVRAYQQLSSGQILYGIGSNIADAIVEDKTPPAKPTLNSVAKTGYAGIQVKWSKVEGADGYEVLRTDAKGNKLTKKFANGATVSWKNTGLKTGTKYTYKVRAYKQLADGSKIFGAYSAGKAATPALNKPVIKSLTAGSKSITVKWNKVEGANGYKVYRSTAKNGKYTRVMTIKNGSTLSWKNTKLVKGKTYYYKVKAYRVVDKKTVYSSISLSKYTKSK